MAKTHNCVHRKENLKLIWWLQYVGDYYIVLRLPRHMITTCSGGPQELLRPRAIGRDAMPQRVCVYLETSGGGSERSLTLLL